MNRVAEAIVQQKTFVIDLDLRAYFDTVRHHLLLDKVALRVQDDDVMRLLRLILKASGKQGVPQGGVISALLSNIYLTEVDRMLERAKTVTTRLGYTAVEYARFADDLVVLVDAHPRHALLKKSVSTLAPLRTLRARSSDGTRTRPVVGEGVMSCPRAGCGRSACLVVCPAKAGSFSGR